MKEKLKKLIPYLIIIIVVIIIRSYIVTPVRVNGSSMDDTLKEGDILILNKLEKNFERYDIVVLDKSVVGDSAAIKRVVGLPGEKISIENGNLYINDKKVDDPYNDIIMDDIVPEILGDDEYFVLGDNRAVSLDSRYFGKVNSSDIEGSAELRLFPFNKIGMVK